MPVVRNLMVRAGADCSGISRQASRASKSMQSMHASIRSSCSGMTRAMSGLTKTLGKLGIAISAAALVSAGKQAKEAYEEAASADARLAQVMRNTVGATEAEIKSVKDLIAEQTRLGVIEDTAQTAAAQELATYASEAKTIRTLLPVLNDMVAQQYGLSASAEQATNIATMLGKVLSGQVGGLSRYGYYFDKAQEEVLKYGTEAQRAAMLAEVVEQSVGGMNAALAATPSGRLKQVNNELQGIQERFGQAVTTGLTVFIPTLNAINSGLAAMATLANRVAQSVANVFGGGAKSGAATVRYTAAAAGAMDDLTDATMAAGKATEKLSLMGFDTIQRLSSGSSGGGSNVSDSGTGGAAASVSEVAVGTEDAAASIGWLEQGLQRIQGVIGSLNFDRLSGSLDRLRSSAEPLGKKLWDGVLWAIDNVLDPLAHFGVEQALPDFLDTVSAGADLLGAAIDASKPHIQYLWDDFLTPAASFAGETFLGFLLDTREVLQGLTDLLRGDKSFSDFFATLSTGTQVAAILTAATIALGLAFGLVTSPVLVAVGAIAAIIAIGTLFTQHSEGIKAALASLGQKFKDVFIGIRDTAKTILNGIIALFEGMANNAISAINAIIRGFNKVKFTAPDWVPVIGGKSFGISIPLVPNAKLPRLADGAVIQPGREFAAILGDQMSGRNIETPERLLRSIYREENGSEEILAVLRLILAAARRNREVRVDPNDIERANRVAAARSSRIYGI